MRMATDGCAVAVCLIKTEHLLLWEQNLKQRCQEESSACFGAVVQNNGGLDVVADEDPSNNRKTWCRRRHLRQMHRHLH